MAQFRPMGTHYRFLPLSGGDRLILPVANLLRVNHAAGEIAFSFEDGVLAFVGSTFAQTSIQCFWIFGR